MRQEPECYRCTVARYVASPRLSESKVHATTLHNQRLNREQMCSTNKGQLRNWRPTLKPETDKPRIASCELRMGQQQKQGQMRAREGRRERERGRGKKKRATFAASTSICSTLQFRGCLLVPTHTHTHTWYTMPQNPHVPHTHTQIHTHPSRPLAPAVGMVCALRIAVALI